MHRIDWRDVPLPAAYPESASDRERILDAKPRHWRQWYDGTLVSNYEAPKEWVPATLTADQVREVNARNAIECELIDEALGRVLGHVAARGWDADTDVVFTTDHGELQGDLGLLFKGPYHVDGLMRLPLIWRPAPSADVTPAVVNAPVGLVDLAPTFCAIAGVDAPDWMEGSALPADDADAAARGFERVLTEWDSELFGVGVHLRTITRDGWVCTTYAPGTVHDGTEGELYRLDDDPHQFENRWDDPHAPHAARRSPRGSAREPARAPIAAARGRGAGVSAGGGPDARDGTETGERSRAESERTIKVAAGYWPSRWPGEDGGPRRTEAPPFGQGLGIGPGEVLVATSRDAIAATMVVLRDPGEAYLLRHTGGDDAVSWVERFDPVSLEPLERSPELPGGPTWPGGMAVHANGSLYVVFGRHAHRLGPDTVPIASRELPPRAALQQLRGARRRLPRDEGLRRNAARPHGAVP